MTYVPYGGRRRRSTLYGRARHPVFADHPTVVAQPSGALRGL
jgi:hypothetical protein